MSLVTNTNLTDENEKVLNPATEEQIRYTSDKLVTGTLPDGANITKVIVEGYTDGVLIAGEWYLGPAASVGKVVGGATLAEIANGSYQWFDMSRPGNQNKTWIIEVVYRLVFSERFLLGVTFQLLLVFRQVAHCFLTD